MTIAVEQPTWGHVRSALAFDRRVTHRAVVAKLGPQMTPQKFSGLLQQDEYSYPRPDFVAQVQQAIDEVIADLDAGREP